MILSIEGNIGAGKSTLIRALRLHYQDHPQVGFADEPLDVWQAVADEGGRSLLELYYADQEKHAFEFQMLALKTRASAISRKAADPRLRLVIAERDIATDKRVFAQMLADAGTLTQTQKQVYDLWYTSVHSSVYRGRTVHRLYLRTEPGLASARTASRARAGEAEIPLEYHERCHQAHEAWLGSLDQVTTLEVGEETAPVDVLSEAVRRVDELLALAGERRRRRHTEVNPYAKPDDPDDRRGWILPGPAI